MEYVLLIDNQLKLLIYTQELIYIRKHVCTLPIEKGKFKESRKDITVNGPEFGKIIRLLLN